MTIEGLKYIIYHSEGTEVEWRSQGWPLGDNSILKDFASLWRNYS